MISALCLPSSTLTPGTFDLIHSWANGLQFLFCKVSLGILTGMAGITDPPVVSLLVSSEGSGGVGHVYYDL